MWDNICYSPASPTRLRVDPEGAGGSGSESDSSESEEEEQEQEQEQEGEGGHGPRGKEEGSEDRDSLLPAGKITGKGEVGKKGKSGGGKTMVDNIEDEDGVMMVGVGGEEMAKKKKKKKTMLH